MRVTITTALYRLIMFCITAAVCVWLTRVTNAWAAIGLWALAIAAVCGGVGLLMWRQPPGRVTPVNYAAGLVLPWGYAIGRGKLLPIVIESWVRWLLLGIAVIVSMTHGPWLGHSSPHATAEYHRGVTVTVLLLLSWLILGAVVLRLVTFLAIRANANPIPPGTFAPILAMTALVIASVALTIFGHNAATTALALLLTGGPIAVVGGGYGLFLLVVLTCGRNLRWN